MSAVTRPRGPLPRRVYWSRRVLVLVVALALVYGVARLLGAGGGPQPQARAVGADASTTPATTPATTPVPTATSDLPTASVTPGKQGTAAATALAQPTGPCSSSDVVAAPSVRGAAHGGSPVVFTVTLTTRTSPGCTWTVSPETLAVKVTSGPDRIWTTQQCPGAILKQSVVLRDDHPVNVSVVWTGRRSDDGCTDVPAWAERGYYHVVAAAFGSDPVDEQFPLLGPATSTVIATPTPTRTPAKAPKKTPAASPEPASR